MDDPEIIARPASQPWSPLRFLWEKDERWRAKYNAVMMGDLRKLTRQELAQMLMNSWARIAELERQDDNSHSQAGREDHPA